MAKDKFNKDIAEHEIKKIKLEAELNQPFALKMALIICACVMGSILICGFMFGNVTNISMIVSVIASALFCLAAFGYSYNRCI